MSSRICPHHKTDYLLFLLTTKVNTTTIIACVLELSARMTLMASILLHNPLRATVQILMSCFSKPFVAKSMHIRYIFNRKLHLVYLNSSSHSGCCGLESRSKFQDPDTFCWFSRYLYCSIGYALKYAASYSSLRCSKFIKYNNPQTGQHIS